jgi:hypothetical protein
MKLKEIRDYYGNEFLQAVYDEIVRLAKENPTFTYAPKEVPYEYRACFYNRGSKVGPSCEGCLVGQALQRLGWSDKIELDFFGDVQNLFASYLGPLTGPIMVKISNAQSMQDYGKPWGECV